MTSNENKQYIELTTWKMSNGLLEIKLIQNYKWI